MMQRVRQRHRSSVRLEHARAGTAPTGRRSVSAAAAPNPPVAAAQAAVRACTAASAAFLAAIALAATPLTPPAAAVLNSPNAQIARTAESALRRATPAFNEDVKTVQRKLEDVQFLLRIPQRKPWGGMAGDVHAAQGLVSARGKMMYAVPDNVEDDARAALDELADQLERLQYTIDRKDPEKTAQAVTTALRTVERLEIIQVRSVLLCWDFPN